jgi:hypothetical protein
MIMLYLIDSIITSVGETSRDSMVAHIIRCVLVQRAQAGYNGFVLNFTQLAPDLIGSMFATVTRL